MAERIPARLTAAEGRKFGFTVGLAFVFFGLLMLWRQHVTRAEIVLGLGGVLVLAALVAPTALGPVERAWMGLAHLISKVTTPIFMGIVYFVVIAPIWFVRRLSGASPMATAKPSASRWQPHTPPADPRESMEHQF